MIVSGKRDLTLFSLSASLFLGGCDSKPTISDVLREMESTQGECPGLEILDLQKVNGEEGQDDQHYALEVKYSIRAKDLRSICKDKSLNDEMAVALMWAASSKGIKIGDGVTVPIREIKRMKKTENGWIFDPAKESE